MPPGLQVQTWFKQGLTGGGFEALAPGTGDSATFFNFPIGAFAAMAEAWAVDDASPAEVDFFASRWHDQQFSIRTAIPDGSTLAPPNRMTNCSPPGHDQFLFPSDELNVQASGTAGDNVNATIVLYYADIPGIDAQLSRYDQIRALTKNLVGINTTLTPGAGDWGTTVALNAADNRLHANTYYAVLGFTAQAPLAAVGLSGVDVGNLRVGGPVIGDPNHDAYLFSDLARAYDAPLIPVINSNNAGAVLLQAADPTAGATVVDVILAELTRQP